MSPTSYQLLHAAIFSDAKVRQFNLHVKCFFRKNKIFIRETLSSIKCYLLLQNILLKDISLALCEKSFFGASRQFFFERHIILMISLHEIIKMMCLSKKSSAAAGGKILFTQLHQMKFFAAKPQVPLVNRYEILIR